MAQTISTLSEKVVNDLYTEFPAMFQQISKAAYVNALQNALKAIIDTDVVLSRTNPDYDAVMIRLIQALSAIPEWSDMITASTAHAITRSIASDITYGQYSIERAYQEAFLASASSDSGVYSGIRMLGLRPQRRQPARTIAQLTRLDPTTILTIPSYSTFTINNQKFFNRETIIFNTNVLTLTAQIFQGVIATTTITSDGEPFQKYTIGSGESNASDIDVIVNVDGVLWTRTLDGAYTFDRQELIYQENTAQNGDIELQFGDGDYGQIPPVSAQIEVTWVKTLGDDANTQNSGLTVTWDQVPTGVTLTGVTITNIENGAPAISSDIYKIIGPDLYAGQGSAVRRSEYKAMALRFPGVKDALFQGQAELAPGRRSMMNVIGYTLLTDENWTLTNHQNFVDKFRQDYGIFQCEYLRLDPIPINYSVKAQVFCMPDVDLQSVKNKLITNLNALFAPRIGYLGRSMYLSDIDDVLNGRNNTDPDEVLEEQVDYVILDPAMQSLVITNRRGYAVLVSVDLDMQYTTRTQFTGKPDLAPNQSDPTVITL